jgi:hypothetical protein
MQRAVKRISEIPLSALGLEAGPDRRAYLSVGFPQYQHREWPRWDIMPEE